jgi:hypothetical protein
VTQPPAAPTLQGVIARLSANPSAYGKRGPDLLERLLNVAGARVVAGKHGSKPEDSAHEAGDTLKQIPQWVAKGEIDPGIATQAQQALQALVGGEDDQG